MLSTRLKWPAALTAMLVSAGIAAAIIKPYPVFFGAANIFFLADGQDEKAAAANVSQSAQLHRLERMRVVASDGAALGALHLKHPQAKALLIYLQGGGSSAWGTVEDAAAAFAALPLDVLIVDYRGTGITGGQANAALIGSDIVTLVRHVRKAGRLPEQAPLLFYGVSMGSLFAGDLARQIKPDGVIFDSAITSLDALVTGQVPAFMRPFSTVTIGDGLDRYDNLRAWRGSGVPMLLLAGQNDQLTPPRFSEEILQHAGGVRCASIALLPDTAHAAALASPHARAAVTAFVTRILTRPAGQGCPGGGALGG